MNISLIDLLLNIKKRPFMSMFIVVGASAIIGLCSTFFLGNDNPIEQASEQVIKSETGVSVDLTPEKKE